MIKKLNALVLLLVFVAFAAPAEEQFVGVWPDSSSLVQDSAVAPISADVILQAQLQGANYRINSLQERIARLEDDCTIARGNELSLQRQNRSLQMQIDSLRRANNAISGMLSNADSIKVYYVKNLFRSVATPLQIRKGVEALKSIGDSRIREAIERFLPGLERMDDLNREVLRVLKGIRDDRRRTNVVYFCNWRTDAKNQLNDLKTRLNESRMPYERLKMVVTVALAKVNAAKDETVAPDFADLIKEFYYIDR